MRKWLKWGLIGLGAFIVLLVVGLWLWGNKLAEKGIEAGGTAALGVKTSVKSVSIGWLSGSVALRGLKIANPEGYQTNRLMALGHGKVACKLSSLLGDEVVVSEILIDEPELTIELKPGLPPKSNLGDLLSAMKSDEPAPAKTQEAKPAAEPQQRFRVDLIRITKTKVRFHLLMGKTADLVLPDIEMKEVRNSDGTLPRLVDIFRQVLVGVGTSAFRNAKGVVPDDLLDTLGAPLASAQKLIGGGLSIAGGAAGKVLDVGAGAAGGAASVVGGTAGKAVGGATKAVGGAIQGILGGKKKDKSSEE